MTIFKYIELEIDCDLALAWLNDPDESMNTVKPQLMDEITAVMDDVEQNASIRALILCSRKLHCFIAGADIKMFQNYPEPHEAHTQAEAAHKLLKRLNNLRVPTIAALRGITLGAGLEIAMACNYRICAVDNKTMFGLPEVKLGLLPGLGGTQRLPALVGLRAALDLLLTGKNLYPRKAKKSGLVDALCHGPGLIDAAKRFARENQIKPSRLPKRSLLDKFLEGSALGRKLVFGMAEKSVIKKTAGNYPAPFKILDCVRTGWTDGLEAGIQREIYHFDSLVRSPESVALVQLFFGMNDSKKNSASKLVRDVSSIGVLGAGLMGAGIAEVSAQKDYRVILKDISTDALGRGEKSIYDSFNKRVKRQIMSAFERDRLMSHIVGVVDEKALAHCDMVIEAVFEDLKLKQRILADMEAVTPEHCIFATNTSSIPITDIAAQASRPELVIGMHYFSPVPKMPLLEIIVTEKTAKWVTATAMCVGIRQGKTVIVVGDGPGFYTTRILAPLMNEAVNLLGEGADIKDIDRAMIQFGFPIGPVKLMDEVGIDVGAHVGDTFAGLMADRDVEPNTTIKKLYEAGFHGRKNGKGFYRYDIKKGKLVNKEIYDFFGGSDRKRVSDVEIQERLSLAMINEAAFCLQEGILRNPKDGDLGAILGLGFPPFLGGPFHYMDHLGMDVILGKFDKWAESKGARYKPAQILIDHRNKKFRS